MKNIIFTCIIILSGSCVSDTKNNSKDLDINIQKLEEMVVDTSLDKVESLGKEILSGNIRGRVVVNISEE